MNSVTDIYLTAFRQTFFFPLTRAQGNSEDGNSSIVTAMERLAEEPAGQHDWENVDDLLAHLGDPADAMAYQEFVYFHPYIQDVLYARGGCNANCKSSKVLRLFRRKSPGSLSITLSCKKSELGEPGDGNVEFTVHLAIARMHLYFFEQNVAALVVEVVAENLKQFPAGNGQNDGRMTLAHALLIQNAMRRLYPPYFENDNMPQYPAAVTWNDGTGGRARWRSNPPEPPKMPEDWRQHVAQRRRNPLGVVWREMLTPLNIEGYEQVSYNPGLPVWRQIIDERLPSMVFVGVESMEQVSEAHMMRLCFMDGPGNKFPYALPFVEKFRAENCYDRFMRGATPSRYMMTGYSFVALGIGNPKEPKDYFLNTIQHHFRRHYFQMGLLLQLQFAALLSISTRVSEASRSYSATDTDEVFGKTMEAIEEEFHRFQQRYWFEQVSNQLQAREMYTLWRERIGLEPIYREVQEQLRGANDLLAQRRAREDADNAALQAKSAERLSIVATYGLILGVAFGLLGMNVVVQTDLLQSFGIPKEIRFGATDATTTLWTKWQALAAHLAVAFETVAAVIFGALLLLRSHRSERRPSEVPSSLTSVLGQRFRGCTHGLSQQELLDSNLVIMTSVAFLLGIAAFVVAICP